MLTSLLVGLRHCIEAEIVLPQKNFFVKNESSVRICYRRNSKLKYIYLATPLQVAQFLKRNGHIQLYSIRNGQVKMYEKHITVQTGKNGQPQQKEGVKELLWQQVQLTCGQVVTYAARHEMLTDKDFRRTLREYLNPAA